MQTSNHSFDWSTVHPDRVTSGLTNTGAENSTLLNDLFISGQVSADHRLKILDSYSQSMEQKNQELDEINKEMEEWNQKLENKEIDDEKHQREIQRLQNKSEQIQSINQQISLKAQKGTNEYANMFEFVSAIVKLFMQLIKGILHNY